MYFSTAVLGTGTVRRLQSASSEWVLTIGKDRLTRSELARVGCFNFIAARNLSHLLADLGVKDLADLYETIAPADLVLPQLGVISLATLGAAFEAKGIGGSNPLETWVRKHQQKLRTFETLKHTQLREMQARLEEKRALKRRKARRQAQAQEIRVDRFTRRAGAAAS